VTPLCGFCLFRRPLPGVSLRSTPGYSPFAAELYEQLPEALRKDAHHACPRCGVRVIYRVPLVGPAYAWELNLTDEQLAAILAVIGRKA
jgi:hypothetical protein